MATKPNDRRAKRVNDPVHEAVMLRRAAEACRNMQAKATGSGDWFDWVPEHLDGLADRLDPRPVDEQRLAFVPKAAR